MRQIPHCLISVKFSNVYNLTIILVKTNKLIRVENFVIHNTSKSTMKVLKSYENTAQSSTDGCERSIASSSAGATYKIWNELNL